MPLPDLPKLERDLLIALRMSQKQLEERVRTTALCHQILATEKPLSKEFKEDILRELQLRRFFALIEPMAERLVREGWDAAKVMKPYAQALIENGKETIAEWIILHAMEHIEADSPDAADWAAMMGRIYKQQFVRLAKQQADSKATTRSLEQAIHWYSKAGTPYHQVNVLALVCRAKRDGRNLGGLKLDVKASAEGLLAAVRSKVKKENWDFAIAIEANLALKQLSDQISAMERKQDSHFADEEIQRWLYDFAGRYDVFAFELGALLRQLRDIWGLDEKKSELIHILQQTAFERHGSALDLNPGMGDGPREGLGQRDLGWLGTAMERSKSVGLISADSPVGSGFVVQGLKTWKDQLLFLTNAHAIQDHAINTLRVTFHGVDPSQSYSFDREVYRSAPDLLNVSVLAFKTAPSGVIPAPLAEVRPDKPSLGAPEQVYVIGHRDLETTTISVYNNLLIESGKVRIRYTTSTAPGAPGSPVFNEDWQAIAMHGADENGYYVDGLRYTALEGLILEAIVDQAQLETGHPA